MITSPPFQEISFALICAAPLLVSAMVASISA